ncbi:MAG: hypothetical protein AMS22_07770 [Thiotrichales bacterium SG8_50]|jgi:hypothetical protein|nr:MAG: hypothetical protein AMS22_07770 [Thiotrichales bacterium SG8_50]
MSVFHSVNGPVTVHILVPFVFLLSNKSTYRAIFLTRQDRAFLQLLKPCSLQWFFASRQYTQRQNMPTILLVDVHPGVILISYQSFVATPAGRSDDLAEASTFELDDEATKRIRMASNSTACTSMSGEIQGAPERMMEKPISPCISPS